MIWDSSLSKILVITDSIDVQDSSGSKANVAFIKSLVISGFQVSVFHLTGRDIALENSQTRNIKELQWTSLFFLSRFQRLFQRYLKIDLSKFLENRFGFSFTFFNDVNSVKKEFEKIDACCQYINTRYRDVWDFKNLSVTKSTSGCSTCVAH